jgi:hypothetical protein
MADPPAPPDTGAVPAPGTPPGTPRWVKVFGIIALVLIVLVVIMFLTGSGHGPSRHGNLGGGHTPPASHMQQP